MASKRFARDLVALSAIREGEGKVRFLSGQSASVAFTESIDAGRANPESVILISVFDIHRSAEELRSAKTFLRSLLGLLTEPGVYVTLPVRELVRHSCSEDLEFKDYGTFISPLEEVRERIFCIWGEGLQRPEQTVEHEKGNCRAPEVSFIGRVNEIHELQQMLLDRRLVSINGAPGMGKKALAIRTARSMAEDFPGGVWHFPMENRSLDSGILGQIRMLWGGSGSFSLRLKSALELSDVRPRLVILSDAATNPAEVADIEEAFLGEPTVTFVVTSVRPLASSYSAHFSLGPLSRTPSRTGMKIGEADRLFIERATQAGYAIGAGDKAAVRAITEFVEGHPHSIEMMVSLLRTYSVKKLQEMVTSRRRLPASLEKRVAPLFAPLYHELSHDERHLLLSLAQFDDRWDYATIEALTETQHNSDLQEVHDSLVSSAWIQHHRSDDTFSLLPTARIYLRSVANREGSFFFGRKLSHLASRWSAGLSASEAIESEKYLRRHYEDLKRFVLLVEDPEDRSALHRALTVYWMRFNRLKDAKAITESLKPKLAGLDLFRAEVMLGQVEARGKSTTSALRHFEAALQIAEEISSDAAKVVAFSNIATLYADVGRHFEAVETHRALLQLQRTVGPSPYMETFLCNAARALQAAFENAEMPDTSLLDESDRLLDEAEDLGLADPFVRQAYLHNRANTAAIRGRFELAAAYYTDAIDLCISNGLEHEAFQAIVVLGHLASHHGKVREAATLFGVSSRLLRDAGHAAADDDIERVGMASRNLQRRMGSAEFRRYFKRGLNLSLRNIKKLLQTLSF